MTRLRTEKHIQLCLPDLESINGILVYHHNCRSLKKYCNNICKEESISFSDLVCFSETHISKIQSTNYQLSGFQLMFADESKHKHGMALYKNLNSSLEINQIYSF